MVVSITKYHFSSIKSTSTAASTFIPSITPAPLPAFVQLYLLGRNKDLDGGRPMDGKKLETNLHLHYCDFSIKILKHA